MPSDPPTITSADHFFFGRRKLKGLSREDKMRMEIADIKDVPTAYRPVQNFLMIVSLPNQGKSDGGILLPNGSRVEYNEGHIVAKGPNCVLTFALGDCVTWAPHQASKLVIEDVEFIILSETQVLMYIPVTTLQEMKRRYAGACEHCNETGGHHKPTCPCHEQNAGNIYAAFASEESNQPKPTREQEEEHYRILSEQDKAESLSPEEVATELDDLGVKPDPDGLTRAERDLSEA